MGTIHSWLPFFRALDTLDAVRPGPRYPRYVRKHASDARWKGPYYLNAKRWRHDLYLVLEHIRLVIQANAPLGPAFGMAVEDYLETNRHWSPERVGRLFKVAGLAMLVLLTALGALEALAEEGWDAWEEILDPVVLSLWLIFEISRQRYKPAAVFASLRTHMERGCTLSEAMTRLPRFFPRNLVSMVAMAEDTGQLNQVLDRFSTETIKHWTAQRDLKRMLLYFGIVLVIQCSVIAFLMVKVVPVFYEILNELEVRATEHPPAPHMLIPLPSMDFIVAFSDWVVYQGSLVTVVLCWSITIWFSIRPNLGRRSWASRWLSTLLFLIPGLRGMMARQNLGTAALMLRHMLLAGVPLEKALATVANADLHHLYRRWFARVRQRLLQGESLREACAGARILAPVPKSFVALVSMGESCGRLEQALEYIAEQYQAQVDRRRRFLIGCMLPLGVLITGYIALSFEASVFHMLVALSDAIIP